MKNLWLRISDELAQAWTVTLKDIKVYYLRPGMIMFGFLMPFFMFFSFSVRREMAAAEGLARLLALTVFFTAAAAGPFIIPTERRMGTYDRLLAAPMSLLTLLLGKISVGAFFAVVVASIATIIGSPFPGCRHRSARPNDRWHSRWRVHLLSNGRDLRLNPHAQPW